MSDELDAAFAAVDDLHKAGIRTLAACRAVSLEELGTQESFTLGVLLGDSTAKAKLARNILAAKTGNEVL